MGNKVAVQTANVRAVGASSMVPDGTYPEGSVISIFVTFSVEVRYILCKNVGSLSYSALTVCGVMRLVSKLKYVECHR